VVFNVRETKSGFRHLMLNCTRKFFRRADTWFIKEYEDSGLRPQRFADDNGKPAICSICGYAMIRLELNNGWLMDTCSAMPVVTGLQTQEFGIWANSLQAAKLPTSSV